MNAAGNENSAKPLLEPLTRREQEILELLAEGLTSGEMAERLTLAVSSVRWYIQQIYGKLGVNGKRQAITRASELGLLRQEHLNKVASAVLPKDFSPPAVRIPPKHNLPIQLTSFVGREKEIETVCELLRQHRLVTLTGSGGVGKTRLSIQVGREMLAETPDGVWYVELAPLSDQDLVPQIVAAAFGLREDPKRPLVDVLNQFLGNRVLLLVLDNCEHLLEACARLAEALLKNAPQLKIFVSSREALGIAGEYAYRVPSLTIPDPRQLSKLIDLQDCEAVRLFTERSRAVLPSFEVDESNAPAIARICQRLDGIPLALELAAARLNLLSPEQLAGRLDSAFRLLTGGSRTALPRQQTLRATIDWSYELLSIQEQILLRRLAVFSGGSTLEAIEAVCNGEGLEAEQILDLLRGLVNKSMVNAERQQHEETRYRLLETVRQYAREKLYEAKESREFYDRHLNYYLELAESIEPQLRTALALVRLHTLEREADNLRSALSWALDDMGSLKTEVGLRLASALLNFWHTQSYQNEGCAWLKKGLSAEGGSSPDSRVRARACFAAGHLVLPLGRHAEARLWLEESLVIYKEMENTSGWVMAQSLMGENCAWVGDFDEAKELGEVSIATSRTLNDPWLLAWVLCRYGTSLAYQGETTLARPLLEESLGIFEELGDPLQVGDHLVMLGWITFDRGDIADAQEYNRKALTAARGMQSKWTEANVLAQLSDVNYIQGDYQQMRSNLIESVAMKREMGHPHLWASLSRLGTAEINLAQPRPALEHFKESLQIHLIPEPVLILGIARAALHLDQTHTAALLFGAAKRMVEVGSFQMGPIEKQESERGWTEARTQLGESVFQQAILEGESLSTEEAIAIALAIEI